MKFERIILWFRNDLRIHDNLTWFKAHQIGKEVIPIFCWDPRAFENTSLGFPKTGSIRTRFLKESLENLKLSIQILRGELFILKGKPEEILPLVAKELGAAAIFFTKEITWEETQVEKDLEEAAGALGVYSESFWQSTLFHLDDLPFPIRKLPEVFTQFRKELERTSQIRSCIDKPEKTTFLESKELADTFKKLEIEILDLEINGKKSQPKFYLKGGEFSALARLQDYFWEKDLLKTYKQTRNGLIGLDYSSKFSPYLALGCLSPRKIYQEVLRYEQERIKNDSTYWLIFELIWRDYFRFIAQKHGSKIFLPQGIKNQSATWIQDRERFALWVCGNTGVPFVDANMRELAQTGFMSNRGRQIVASFLVNDLAIDWTWGASYFESQLVDYDVCSNWGNWMYVAGVGNDPRENRYFQPLTQAKNYDPQGEYVRKWIPELARIKGFEIHQPWSLSKTKLKNLRIELGISYPEPIIQFEPKSY